jgi:hypothetical protein
MKFDCILVNGDSYSALPGNREGKVYADFLGEYFNVPSFNISARGSNNDRIVRSTIEHLEILIKKNYKPLVIIGWSFVRRIEVWYYGNKNVMLFDQVNEEHLNPKFTTLDFIINSGAASFEEKAMLPDDSHIHKRLTDFYTQNFLLSNYFENKDIPYFFFSGARNTDSTTHCFPWLDNMYQVAQVKQNKNIHNLHDFCIANWAFENDPDCASTGHLSENGHRNFSKILVNWLDNTALS